MNIQAKTNDSIFFRTKVKTLTNFCEDDYSDLLRIRMCNGDYSDYFNHRNQASNFQQRKSPKSFKKESEVRKMRKLILTTVLAITLCSAQLAQAQIPHLISYQGRLTDNSGTPITGSRNMTFRIWDAKTGGSKLWEDTYSVTIDEGIFEVLLGSGSQALDREFDKPYYLEIVVDGEVMSERQQLASSGYAYRAKKADEADHAIEAVNAETVSGIEASSTPEANKLLALDANGKFPASVTELPYTAGNCLIAYSDGTDQTGSDTTPVKLKEIKLARDGACRIEFKLSGSTGPYSGNAQVYRNGTPVGTLQHSIGGGSGNYKTCTEDISGWQAGDLCQLYAYKLGVSNKAYVTEFRMYVDGPTTELVTQGTGPNSP